MRISILIALCGGLLFACSQGNFTGDSGRSKSGKGMSSSREGAEGAIDGSSWQDDQVGALGGDGNVSGQGWWPTDVGMGTGGSNNGGADGGGVDRGDQIGANAGSATADDIFGGENSTGVPSNCVNQKILIVDLKSGWWDDDGGTLYRDVVAQEMNQVCKGVVTAIEYKHFTVETNAEKYYDETNFGNYTQVWILSGTTKNDILTSDPAFVDLLNQIRQFKPNLFLGAGFGSTPHANAVAQTVWGMDAFRTDFGSTYSLEVTATKQDFTVRSRVRKLMGGNLFAGVDGHLADQMNFTLPWAMGMTAFTGSDEIVANLPGMTPVGSCLTAPYDQSTRTGPFKSPPLSKASREVICIGVAQHNGMNIVLDSGLQRFYSAYKAEEGNVKRYIRNIARALAL